MSDATAGDPDPLPPFGFEHSSSGYYFMILILTVFLVLPTLAVTLTTPGFKPVSFPVFLLMVASFFLFTLQHARQIITGLGEIIGHRLSGACHDFTI